jgi:glycosyltransferase involved in cell wall biosynthesis
MSKLRVLWFTNTFSNFDTNINQSNGGGWISSLENELKKNNIITLAIAFNYNKISLNKYQGNSVYYYPLYRKKNLFKKITSFFNFDKQIESHLFLYKEVIDDFKPDIIQVFGTENPFGLVSSITSKPILIHLQGILNPYFNAYFPPGFSTLDIFSNILTRNPLKSFKILYNYYKYFKLIKMEKKIFEINKFYLGRTEWDKLITKTLSPSSSYFHCNEILRPIFYTHLNHKRQSISFNDKIIITTIISDFMYKGADLILKTAQLLSNIKHIKFEWNVYGNCNFKDIEKKINIYSKNINVYHLGILNENQIYKILNSSNIYFHPSYIENSPNSICEAQILGLPVISTNVGGISSLITNYKTGLLIPANDPFYGVAYIIELIENNSLYNLISSNSKTLALERHNTSNIINNLLRIYHQLSKNN